MPHIQELIYELEVGRGPRIVRILATILAVLALAWWYDTREFKNFYAPEAMEAAQLARNLASGRGYTTEVIRPLSLHLVVQKQGLQADLDSAPHPDLMNPPAYPLFLAGLMKLLPFKYQIDGPFLRYQPEVIIAVANQVLFLMVIGLMAGLASRLFSIEVGILTLAFLLLSDTLWRFSTSGLSTMMVMVWVALWVRVLLRLDTVFFEGDREKRGLYRWAALCGLLIGLAALTRYSMLGLLVPTVAYVLIFFNQRRFKVSLVVVLVATVVVTPWLVRNYQLCGHPFGLAGFAIDQGSIAYPRDTLERTLEPEMQLVGLNDYGRKLVLNLYDILTHELPRLGGNWLGGFFLAGLLLRFRSGMLSRLRYVLLIALVTLAVLQALGRTHLSERIPDIHSENLLILLVPPLLVYGAAFLSTLLDQMRLPIIELRHFITTVFLGVSALPMILTFLPPPNVPINYPPYYPVWIQTNARLLEPEELMMSDMPWAVAWYGDRQCVWIPRNPRETFFEIHDRHKRVSALYLTQLTTDVKFLSQMIQGRDYDWARFAAQLLLREELPDGFPLKDVWSYYLPDQLFLADRPRWRTLGGRAPERPTTEPTGPHQVAPPLPEPTLPSPVLPPH